MAFKEIFIITRHTKILFIFLVCLTITGFAIAYFYYGYKNKAEDPRIIDARYKLDKFDELLKERNYEEALPLLDTINDIYKNAKGYEGSFEFGTIYNNRGSIYLSRALYDSLISQDEKDTLLAMAEEEINKSIEIYKAWIDSVGILTEEQIRMRTKPSFNENDAAFKGKNLERIIEKRVDDIVFAQTETPRRLSVSYTNLGIVQRHQLKQEDAMESYIEAIKLWKDNYTARNNFNVLMGRPTEDRSIIDQLFPPDRSKKEQDF